MTRNKESLRVWMGDARSEACWGIFSGAHFLFAIFFNLILKRFTLVYFLNFFNGNIIDLECCIHFRRLICI